MAISGSLKSAQLIIQLRGVSLPASAVLVLAALSTLCPFRRGAGQE
jgi:hypothetical protein